MVVALRSATYLKPRETSPTLEEKNKVYILPDLLVSQASLFSTYKDKFFSKICL